MNDRLSNDAPSNSVRRRILKSIRFTNSKYAWLVGIICILIGGGVTAAVKNLTSNATRELLENENLLDQSQNSVEQMEMASVGTKDKNEAVDIELLTPLEGNTTLTKTLTENVKQLKLLNRKLNSLQEKVDSIIEKQGTSQPEINADTVYIQYSQKYDKSKIELLQQYLKSKGYTVPDVQSVKSRQPDIRYFHTDEYDNAIKLKNYLKYFIKNTLKVKGAEIKVKDFSQLYPNAQKNTLEIWL